MNLAELGVVYVTDFMQPSLLGDESPVEQVGPSNPKLRVA